MSRLLGTTALALALGWGALGATGASGAITAATPSDGLGDPTCDGRTATIVATAKGQTLRGTAAADVISAAGYIDVHIIAGAGDDVVCNEPASVPTWNVPTVDAGEGDDVVHAGTDVTVHAGPGDDTLTASGSGTAMFGEDGADHLEVRGDDPYTSAITADGGAGDDVLTTADVDYAKLLGGDGTDDLTAGGTAGDVTLDPGAGDDTITATTPTSGGILSYSGSAPLDFRVAEGVVEGEGLDTFSGITAFSGGSGADLFTGTDGPDTWVDEDSYSTRPGADTIIGAGGDDVLSTVLGTIDAGPGDDTIVVRAGTARGGEGDDVLAIRQSGTAYGGPGDDSIRANWSGLEHTSFDGPARFFEYGGPGDDVLLPATAFDIGSDGQYDSCTGNDPCRVRIDGAAGHDTLDFGSARGPATLDLAAESMRYRNGRGRITGIEAGRGTTRADRLLGTSGADTLMGGFGKDVLIGRGGPDTLIGDRDRDTAFGGPGRDVCRTEVRRSC